MNREEPTTIELICGTLTAVALIAILWTFAAIF
jgi:hypothetical protein